ncbi:MAG: UbiD family decarboxylase [Candidatus Binatia bacterium]
MPHKDLREYIAHLENEEELQRIEEQVQPVYEVGAIIRRSYELQAPAPVFLNLRGYPDQAIFGAPIGLSGRKGRTFARFAISMDMPPESTPLEIIEEYIQRIKKPIKPDLVKDGTCKENVLLGDAVDLQIFPAPFLHQGDIGPYLGTWHVNVTKDPDSGVDQWGLCRLMIQDKRTMIAQDIGLRRFTKYEAQPREFAIALGTEPVTSWVAGTGFPLGASEVDIIGGIRQTPLELVKCEIVDLAVPATSEIVIEGLILPRRQREDGSGAIYYVTAITHRNNPILPVSCMGMSIDDSSVSFSLIKAAHILDEVRSRGLTVKAVYCPPEAASHWTVASTKIPYSDCARNLAQAIWQTGWGRSNRYLFIVEEDVDVSDMGQVLWAVSTTGRSKHGILQVGNELEERTRHLEAYASLDCPWPREWPKEAISTKAYFDNIYPKEVQEKVLRDWHAYGYK